MSYTKYVFTKDEIPQVTRAFAQFQVCMMHTIQRYGPRNLSTHMPYNHVRDLFPPQLQIKTSHWTCKHFELARDRSGITSDSINRLSKQLAAQNGDCANV